jgi:hypothetical protein
MQMPIGGYRGIHCSVPVYPPARGHPLVDRLAFIRRRLRALVGSLLLLFLFAGASIDECRNLHYAERPGSLRAAPDVGAPYAL